MEKFLKILENYESKDKDQYIYLKSLPEEKDLMKKLIVERTIANLRKDLLKKANLVLKGECPHERDFLRTEMVLIEPRDWMSWKEERSVYGKCKNCGQ